MTLPIAIVLGIVLVALVLFTFERIPLEVSSLVLVMLLSVTQVLEPEQAFSGFSNPTVIFLFCLLVMTQGLASTGVVQLIGQRMAFFARYGHTLFVLAMMVAVATFSSFISNTVTTAAFLPVAIGAAERAKIPPSKVLMPLAYASILGGTIFLIGTSTNLAVSSAMTGLGLEPIGFAELAPLGLPFAVLGIAFITLFGRWLLPSRTGDEATGGFPSREYLAEVVLPPGSAYIGKPLSELTQGLGLKVLGLVRGKQQLEPDPAVLLTGEDRVILEEDRLALLRVKSLKGVELAPDVNLAPHTFHAPEFPPLAAPEVSAPAGENPAGAGAEGEVRASAVPAPALSSAGPDSGGRGTGSAARGGGAAGEPVVLMEASVPVGSSLVGRTLKETFFAEHFGMVALALARRPAIQRLTKMQLLHGLFGTQSLSSVPLVVGDVLLLRGPRSRARVLADGRTLTFLSDVEYQQPRYGKAVMATAIFLAVLALGVTKVMPLPVAGLCGVVAMLATRCVDANVAFRVDWRVLVLIGAMMALGLAMEETGAGNWLGGKLVPLAGVAGPRGLLCVLMVLTVILSAPMSNQAAALVLLPVAVGVARQLGLDPRPFAIGVCLAASCSFMTPLEPSCVMVYGPGRYKFTDFFRLGTPLTLALLVLLTACIPLVWPFSR